MVFKCVCVYSQIHIANYLSCTHNVHKIPRKSGRTYWHNFEIVQDFEETVRFFLFQQHFDLSCFVSLIAYCTITVVQWLCCIFCSLPYALESVICKFVEMSKLYILSNISISLMDHILVTAVCISLPGWRVYDQKAGSYIREASYAGERKHLFPLPWVQAIYWRLTCLYKKQTRSKDPLARMLSSFYSDSLSIVTIVSLSIVTQNYVIRFFHTSLRSCGHRGCNSSYLNIISWLH